MLEKLLEVVSHILEDTEDIDNILKYEELEEFRTKEILDKTDQEMRIFPHKSHEKSPFAHCNTPV